MPPTPKRAPSPAKKAASSDGGKQSYTALVDEIERTSVPKPGARPPTDIGTTPDGQAFLAENAHREGVVTLPCGIQYKVIKAAKSSAESPKLGTECDCHYRGTLLDGFEFDSSGKRGKPATFAPKNVIRGWTIAMQLMGVGDKWTLWIPSEYAYGDAGRADAKRGQYIPGGAVLCFELEILKVGAPHKPRPKRPAGMPNKHGATSSGIVTATPMPLSTPAPAGTAAAAAAAAASPRAGHGTLEASEAWADELSGGVFAMLDGDGNGTVSINELVAKLQLVGEPLAAAVLLFDTLDVDRDGRITRDELKEGMIEAGVGNPAAAKLRAVVREYEDSSRHATEAALAAAPVQPSTAAPSVPAAPPRRSPPTDPEAMAAFDAGVDATLEAVSTLLHRLEMPTLRQALSDLGLPNDGEKAVLSERLTNALQP